MPPRARRRRCDHCHRLKDRADLIEGCNYLGWPMRVCEPCIEHQEKVANITGLMGLVVILAFFAWHLFLAAQIEQGRQLLCDGLRKASVWCEAGEQPPGGFQVHPVPGPR